MTHTRSQLARRPLPRMHSDREFCLFSNDLGQSVGECALEVRGWLADHPEYRGHIYGDWNIGSSRDHFDATTLFFPEDDDDEPDVGPEPLTASDAMSAVNLLDAMTARRRRTLADLAIVATSIASDDAARAAVEGDAVALASEVV